MTDHLSQVFAYLCQLICSWIMLVSVQQTCPARAVFIYALLEFSWELRVTFPSLFPWCECCSHSPVRAGSRWALQGLNRDWNHDIKLSFIWVQVVGTAVCSSIFWAKAQLANRQRWLTGDMRTCQDWTLEIMLQGMQSLKWRLWKSIDKSWLPWETLKELQ